MNRQEAFETVWNKFVVEGAPPSKDSYHLSCFYYMGDGRRCAIGLLVTEDEAKVLQRNYPNSGINRVLKDRALPESVLGLGENFLLQLQRTHDDYAGNVKDRLERFSNAWHMRIPS